jgi:hypothetical protein
MNVLRTCGTALKIPWTLRFSDRGSNGKASRLGSRVERAYRRGCLSIIRPARDDDPLPSLVRRDLLIAGVLSALAMTAALAWACALGQRWVVAEEALV